MISLLFSGLKFCRLNLRSTQKVPFVSAKSMMIAIAALVISPGFVWAQILETSAGDAITVTNSLGTPFTNADFQTGSASAETRFGPSDTQPNVEIETHAMATASTTRLGSLSDFSIAGVDFMTDWEQIDVTVNSGATFRDSFSVLGQGAFTLVLDYTLTGSLDAAIGPANGSSMSDLERMLDQPGSVPGNLVYDVSAAFDGSNVLSDGGNLEILPEGPYLSASLVNQPLQVSLGLGVLPRDFSITLSTSANTTLFNFDGTRFESSMTSDFASTLTLNNAQLFDATGNKVSLSQLVSANGTDFSTVSVPEPGTLAPLCLVGVGLTFARRRPTPTGRQDWDESN